ncbi:MAG TPA: hypothetical protein VFV50_08425, partial [Bdellovibrionales bacterium]|nr:hypothetical protein [Bdellovibrionales bacterium]
KDGHEWICDSPMGRVRVKFAEPNRLGVMDHDVKLPSGEINHNPFRVLQNGRGSEVVFTLYRRPNVTDEAYDADARQIEEDLQQLKHLLEKSNGRKSS